MKYAKRPQSDKAWAAAMLAEESRWCEQVARLKAEAERRYSDPAQAIHVFNQWRREALEKNWQG